ncbi:argininosuccinate lyase [Candidatus Peregrinibacteria bacterium]|nr:argininosuccinate lyase [Candidatus Peregrinibacteria bacterium]
MSQLWKKSHTGAPNPFFQKYTTGTDPIFDLELFPFDVKASTLHVKMLQKIGILSKSELKKLLSGFEKLLKKYEAGKITILSEDEDCHTIIENEMIKICGETAKKIHTGRSRNDQVLVALRLLMIQKLTEILRKLKKVSGGFVNFAEKYQGTPFPGYSHTREAMLSSIDHYFLGYTELLLNDYEYLKFAKKQTSQNPLGTGAGYGSSFPLDREMTTKELGFEKIQLNSLSTQLSRGKFELFTMDALVQLMLTLGKFANDICYFSMDELQYFLLDDAITTGSSMMPQKRNPDGFEILRGFTSVVIGNQHAIQGISQNSFTGYNRDFQLIKKPLLESLTIVSNSLEFVSLALTHLKPNQKNIEQKISSGIFAADIANDLVKEKKIPFRDAYKMAMQKIGTQKINLQENIRSKISLGAPGNAQLEWYKKMIEKM